MTAGFDAGTTTGAPKGRLTGPRRLRLLDAVEVEALRLVYSDLGPTPGDGNVAAFRTAHCHDVGYRRAVEELLGAALAAPLARAGLGEASLGDAGFVMAWPGAHSGEGIGPAGPPGTVGGFLALDDVDGGNGGWWYVPGPTDEPACAAHQVCLERGDAVLLAGEARTFTLANHIDKPRLGVTFTLSPGEAVDHSVGDEVSPSATGAAEAPRADRDRCCTCGAVLAVAEDRWARAAALRCPPCTVAAESAPPWVRPPRPVDAADRLAFQVRTFAEPWERAFVTSGDGPTERPPPAEPALADPTLDATLQRDGYVAPPGVFLDPAGAAALRAAFEQLHGTGGRGFHNDFNDRDLDYRRRAASLVTEALSPVVRELFVDHVGFIHPFLVKFPGEASYFKPHRDWMYVDERAGHRSFVLFVALEEVGEANGEVLLLPGSHRLDTMARGTMLEAPWMRESELLADRMQPCPLPAGGVLIWDHAVVHGSRPNLTARPRLAAAVWVAPVGVPLRHYRRIDDARACAHEVEPSFWTTQNPFRLMLHAPSETVAEVVPVGGAALGRAGLIDALDALEARGAAGSAP